MSGPGRFAGQARTQAAGVLAGHPGSLLSERSRAAADKEMAEQRQWDPVHEWPPSAYEDKHPELRGMADSVRRGGEEPKSEISAQLHELARWMNRIDEEARMLASRLAPVLRGSPDATPMGAAQPEEPPRSELANALRERVEMARQTVDYLRLLHELLAL